jgi:hypothetical protein
MCENHACMAASPLKVLGLISHFLHFAFIARVRQDKPALQFSARQGH